MPTITRSKMKLSRKKIKELQALAVKIDREQGPRLRKKAREAYLIHERTLALLADLKATREELGLSLHDMAERTGIAKPNLSRLENNPAATPSLDTLNRYARGVGGMLKVDLIFPDRKKKTA